MTSRDKHAVVDELSYEMVVEIAETISRFASASHMYKDITLDEDLLLTLLASQFPAIQSSTYLLLNHLYQNLVIYPAAFPGLVEGIDVDSIDQYLEESVGKVEGLVSPRLLSLVGQNPPLQLEQDDTLNPALRNYLMGWTLVAQKYSSQAYLQHEDLRQNQLNCLQKKSLSILFESRPETYLTFVQKALDTLTLLDLGTEQQLAK